VEVNLVLVVDSNQERGDVDDATIDGDVTALDQGSGMVDRVSKLGLEDAGLESSLQQLVEGHSQDVIETVLGFLVQQTELEHLSQQGSAFEESALVLGIESEEFSGSLSEASQNQLDSPDFSLVLQAELTADLDFLIVAFLLEGSSGLLRSF